MPKWLFFTLISLISAIGILAYLLYPSVHWPLLRNYIRYDCAPWEEELSNFESEDPEEVLDQLELFLNSNLPVVNRSQEDNIKPYSKSQIIDIPINQNRVPARFCRTFVYQDEKDTLTKVSYDSKSGKKRNIIIKNFIFDDFNETAE